MRRGSGLTGVVVALFDVNHGIWVNRVTLTLPADLRVVWLVLLVLLGGQVNVDSQH